jgi:PIN domain nuclease of toxin-antitoxin system
VILLDTHAWIWLLTLPEELSTAARKAVENAPGHRQLVISAISVWELFMLVKKGRLELTVPPAAFLTSTNRDPRFQVIPIDERIARRSVELPDIHADPADRMILATAAELGAPVVSKDARFASYNLVPVVW